MAAELKGDPIGRGELQIGGSAPNLSSQRGRPRKPFPVERGKPQKAIPSLKRDVLRRVVRSEEPVFVVLVEWNQRCDPPCQPGMSRERPVFCPRQLNPALRLGERDAQRCGASGTGGENRYFHGDRITPRSKRPIS
jgi:hypothetical protein